jgi:hypothetical protein
MSVKLEPRNGQGASNLWVITSYFNPIGYQRRLENYHTFRQHLAVPLVTVELAFDGAFQLHSGDADILVQVRGGDVLWQKERLLNLALKSLPDPCDKVAWLDCDVVFESDDWAARASQALDHFGLLHLFHERHDLPPDVRLDQLRSCDADPTSRSVVHKMTTGEATPEDLYSPNALLVRRSGPGLAWASRREVLEQHGLYDACIMGGGDTAILCAALGEFGCFVRALGMNARRAEHYLIWARPYFESVQGRVGHIPGRMFHLWHGDLRDRGYGERRQRLARFDFDPFADIAIDSNGCWRWNSDKQELHEFIKCYFESRNEDGVAVTYKSASHGQHAVPLIPINTVRI